MKSLKRNKNENNNDDNNEGINKLKYDSTNHGFIDHNHHYNKSRKYIEYAYLDHKYYLIPYIQILKKT